MIGFELALQTLTEDLFNRGGIDVQYHFLDGDQYIFGIFAPSLPTPDDATSIWNVKANNE